MGLGVATYGSIGVGICTHPSHDPPVNMTGIVIGGAPTVRANGKNVGQVTNIVLGDCGHTGVIVTSSGTVRANGLGMAYIGSEFVGDFSGIIVTGSGNVTTGM